MSDGFNFINRIVPDPDVGGGMSAGPAAGAYSRQGGLMDPGTTPGRDPQGPSLWLLVLLAVIVYLSSK
jgi:hypothetical protein